MFIELGVPIGNPAAPPALAAVAANPVRKLAALGQSVWLDYIERGFVRGGGLARLIAEDAVSGVTSNPAIFHQAIVGHHAYDKDIERFVRAGLRAHEIHEALVIQDICEAADLLRPLYTRTQGREGFVSLEVSPHLARDAEATCREGQRLWTLVNRPNLLIKVPGTVEGVAAVRKLIADGINVNVTLLFTEDRYAAAADAFMAGLTQRAARGHSVDKVACVASFFVSRIDALVDRRLDSLRDRSFGSIRGQCAVASARSVYRRFESIVASARWRELASLGARPQRVLWASTGTKDAQYSDVKYVEALIGADTITTVPLDTLAAYRDHGDPQLRLTHGRLEEPPSFEVLVERLAAAGIDWSALAAQLEEEGLRKFVEPHEATLAALRARVQEGHTPLEKTRS